MEHTSDELRQYNKIQQLVHQTAIDHGWWEEPIPSIGEKLLLIVTEITEAAEAYRSNPDILYRFYEDGIKPDGFFVELADAVIRIMDLCEYNKIDLETVIIEKNKYNQTRDWKHGGKTI